MANTLTTAKTYYVRARHKATTGLTSDWSNPVKFTTAALTIDKPDFVNVSKLVEVASNSYSIDLKPFSANGGQSLLSVDWQVSSSATFSPITSERLNDTTNTKRLPVTGIGPNSSQYVRYRYRSSANVVSEWSDAFTVRGGGYSVDPINFVKTAQIPVATNWELELNGGDANWGLAFAQTEWEFSTSPSFPVGFTDGSESVGFTGTANYYETNASSTNQNFVKHLSTKRFIYDKTYHIRARKAYTSGSGAVKGPWVATTSVLPAPIAALPIMTIPAANGSSVLRVGGMYTFQIQAPYLSNSDRSFYLVTADWEIINAVGTVVHASSQPGTVLNIDGGVLVAGNTYRIRVRVNGKTVQLPQYSNGYAVTSPWSALRSFLAIDKL